MDLRKRLEKKGWSKTEIDRAIMVVSARDEHHSDFIVYWITLVLGIVGNIVISIMVVHPYIAGIPLISYMIIIVLGLSFGVLYEGLLRHTQAMGQGRYKTDAIFAVCIAFASMTYIALLGKGISQIYQQASFPHPLLMGLVYAAFFSVPFLVHPFFVRNEAA